mmetsp:Transcript_28563/g.69451  ORF Transcript_28563/g.69451 Transcript_28563/m.69451 type:complete len:86 (+) Transcript_28563:53-310(+)
MPHEERRTTRKRIGQQHHQQRRGGNSDKGQLKSFNVRGEIGGGLVGSELSQISTQLYGDDVFGIVATCFVFLSRGDDFFRSNRDY